MKIVLVPSATTGTFGNPLQYATSYLINDRIAIDAGTLGFYQTPADQARVRDVLLSHSHSDHIASLAIFIENVFEGRPDCPTIHANAETLDCLRRDVFNDRVWPDFLKLSEGSMKSTPFLKLNEIGPGQILEFGDLRITTVAVDHLIPTLGFILHDAEGSVVISSDTGPTQDLWDRANRLEDLRAVFLEVCFPDEMEGLAKVSRHLTPAMFAAEVRKLHKSVPIHAVHLKARFREQVAQELESHAIPHFEIARFGVPYFF